MVFGITWFECVSKPRANAEQRPPPPLKKYKSPAINSTAPTQSPSMGGLSSGLVPKAMPSTGLSVGMAFDTGHVSPGLTVTTAPQISIPSPIIESPPGGQNFRLGN